MDYRAIDFLNNFDEESRKKIIEFGKKISSDDLAADVYLIMARKAICFIDVLCENKLAYLNGIVVSDRVLDMNIEWLSGKKVTVIDDALVSGTTLRKVIDKLENVGVAQIKTFVLSINTDWYNPEMLTDKNNVTYLAKPRYHNVNEKCMKLCYDIVKALSTIPKPYDIDFPLYGEFGVEKQKLDELLNGSWGTFNVTSSSHISNSYASKKKSPKSVLSEYESVTFIPSDVSVKRLTQAIGVDFGNSCVLKVRTYIRKRTRKTSEYRITLLPFVIFDEIEKKDIDRILLHIFKFDAKQLIENELITYSSKFRLMQFVVAMFLMKVFFEDFGFNDEETRGISLPTAFNIPNVQRMRYIFTENITNIILELMNNEYQYENVLNIRKMTFKTTSEQIKERNNISNSVKAYEILAQKFTELYHSQELDARQLAKKYGKKVFEMSEYTEVMQRLEKGYTFRELTTVIDFSDINDFVVSLFLDYAIDAGIAVPITYVKDKSVVRAYRHGEDVIFADVEAKQLAYMIYCFLEISNRNEIPALLMEKLLTTFVRFGLHDGIFEKYDYKKIHTQERDFVRIAYYLHGTTPRVINNNEPIENMGIITADTKSCWLRDVLTQKGYLIKKKRNKTTSYCVNNKFVEILNQENENTEHGKIAKRIAGVVGYLYKQKVVTEHDLVLLNATFGHDQIIPALYAEVNIIRDSYSTFKYLLLKCYDEWHAMNWIVAYRANKFFIAQNSGFMKLNSYLEREPQKIIKRISEVVVSEFETEIFYDEFVRYWTEKVANIKEEVDEEVERLINIAAIYIVQCGIIFRLIELAIFRKHKISQKIATYFDELTIEISNNNLKNQKEIATFITKYNKSIKEDSIFAYFKRCNFDINSNSIKDERRKNEIIVGKMLIDDINVYLDLLKKLSFTNNLLQSEYLMNMTNQILECNQEFDICPVLSQFESINAYVEKSMHKACKYINNRGEIEKPIDFPNVLLIEQIEENIDDKLFQDIIKIITKRQIKLHKNRKKAELMYQRHNNSIVIIARGDRTDESLFNLAVNIKEELNSHKQLKIRVIIGLDSVYAPYRFEDCVSAANLVTFFRWFEKLEYPSMIKENEFVIINDATNDIYGNDELDTGIIKGEIKSELTEIIVESKPYDGLQGKEYRFMYIDKEKKAERDYSVNGFTIGVICAKENEYKGVHSKLKEFFGINLEPQLDKESNMKLIDIGHIIKRDTCHTLILTKCEQGNTGAAIAYNRLAHFKPDYIIFVGIAGTCNPKEVNLGDVIIPNEIYDAALKKEENEKFQLRGRNYKIPGDHIGIIDLFKRKMENKYEDFKVIVGNIISDNTVYASDNSQILKSIFEYNDKIDGIEMESGGMCAADYEQNKTKYGVFTIRGVSDNANSIKNDDYHDLAIKNASAIFCEFIEFLFLHINEIKQLKNVE